MTSAQSSSSMNLSDENVFRLRDCVLTRFEANINDGTLFLYNYRTKDLLSLNYTGTILISMVDGILSLEKIKEKALKLFDKEDIDALKRSIDILFSDLIEKSMIEKA